MGWSGGIFTRVRDWTEDEAGGYDIVSSRFDEEDDNFETGINACLHKGGQNSPTANLPMGGFIHTGVGTGTTRDSYASIAQVQDGSFKYGSAFNNLNAYTLALNLAPASYVAGQQFNFKPANTNSGAVTLNVNSLGAKSVYYNGAECPSGTIVSGRVYTVIYDGTVFHLIGAGGGSGGASYGGAKLCMSSSTSIGNSSEETVQFGVKLYDDSNYCAAPPTSYFLIPISGRYRLTGYAKWESLITSVGSSHTAVWFTKNTVTMQSSLANCYVTSTWWYLTPDVGTVWEGSLSGGDIIRMKAYHINTEAKPRNLWGSGVEEHSTYMAIERIL